MLSLVCRLVQTNRFKIGKTRKCGSHLNFPSRRNPHNLKKKRCTRFMDVGGGGAETRPQKIPLACRSRIYNALPVIHPRLPLPLAFLSTRHQTATPTPSSRCRYMRFSCSFFVATWPASALAIVIELSARDTEQLVPLWLVLRLPKLPLIRNFRR